MKADSYLIIAAVFSSVAVCPPEEQKRLKGAEPLSLVRCGYVFFIHRPHAAE